MGDATGDVVKSITMSISMTVGFGCGGINGNTFCAGVPKMSGTNDSVAGSLGNDGSPGIKGGVVSSSINASAGVNEGVEEVLDTLWGVIMEAEATSNEAGEAVVIASAVLGLVGLLIMDAVPLLMTFTIADLLCFSTPMHLACWYQCQLPG